MAAQRADGCGEYAEQAGCLRGNFRGTDFFQFFYAGDNLDHSAWDPRSLSGGVRLDDKAKIVLLAFELGLKIKKSKQA